MAKETLYFSHDYGARNDPKLQSLIMNMGMEGIGIFWCIIEFSYEQEGVLLIRDIPSYAFNLRIELDRLRSVLYNFELFKFDEKHGVFYSPSVIERLSFRSEKSVKAKKSIGKRWEKYKINDTNVLNNDTNVLNNDTNVLNNDTNVLNNDTNVEQILSIKIDEKSSAFQNKIQIPLNNTPKNTNVSKNDTNVSKNDTNVSKNDTIKKRKGKERKERKEKGNTSVVLQPLVEYTLCVDFWLKQFHPGWTFAGMQGKAMKSIIKKISQNLKDSNKEPTTELILDTFKLICIKLPNWYKEKDLNTIDSKYNEIISQIKNQQNGHQPNHTESKFRKPD